MRTVIFGENKVNLLGKEVSVGKNFRYSTVTKNNLEDLNLEKTNGVRVFLTVLSLDTPVCDLEIRRFNDEIDKLNSVTIFAISMDLPFAQSRWCGAANIKSVEVLSDYKNREFGMATGTLADQLALLTRAAFVVDSNGKVVYSEYTKNASDPPNYEAILEVAKNTK